MIETSILFSDGTCEGPPRDEQDKAEQTQERALPRGETEGSHLDLRPQAAQQQGRTDSPAAAESRYSIFSSIFHKLKFQQT
jgi:hypothetical protein